MFSDPENNIKQLALNPGMVVADFGSGAGSYTLALAKAVTPSGRVLAVDIQQDLLQKLKNSAKQYHLNNIDIIWGDLEHLGGTKLRENSVDVIVTANLFFQIENRDSLCLEAKRVLRPNGRILVVDWAGSFAGIGPQEKDVISQDKMKILFEDHDFIFDREINAGSHHYGLIFRKIIKK